MQLHAASVANHRHFLYLQSHQGRHQLSSFLLNPTMIEPRRRRGFVSIQVMLERRQSVV
jgi:hypothetical protein